MSVVCAKIYNDKIQISADSIRTNGKSKRTDTGSCKLVRANNMIVGSTGSAQEGSLMRHFIKTHRPKEATEKAVLDFMVEFSKWKKDYGDGDEVENSYILAYDKKCFEIECMFVCEITNYCAVGAGSDFATAALYLGHSPREAVRVSAELSCCVAEPIIEEEMLR